MLYTVQNIYKNESLKAQGECYKKIGQKSKVLERFGKVCLLDITVTEFLFFIFFACQQAGEGGCILEYHYLTGA